MNDAKWVIDRCEAYLEKLADPDSILSKAFPELRATMLDTSKPKRFHMPRIGYCGVDGCKSNVFATGLCRYHYQVWRQHGTTLWEPLPRELIFWSRVHFREDYQCWEWIGNRTQQGYGKFGDLVASRLAYEFSVGPIPEGHYVLHRCDNPPCVNPEHLFTGTQQDNVDDMMAKGRLKVRTKDIRWTVTHCPHGHPYNQSNTFYKGNARQCRACNALRSARHRLLKKGGK